MQAIASHEPHARRGTRWSGRRQPRWPAGWPPPAHASATERARERIVSLGESLAIVAMHTYVAASLPPRRL